MVLVFDPRGAGISGDMVLAALVDMGADGEGICGLIRECAGLIPGSSIREMSFRKESRGGVRCTRLVLETDDQTSLPAGEVADAIRGAASKMGLSGAAAEFANRSIRSLISAEARIHGVSPDSVHLHEAASLDTLVDIAGTAAALDQLDAAGESVITMPVNVGGGFVTFSHGTFPNPAPAVLEILREAGIPVEGGPAGTETATPTGACILAGLQAAPRPFYPQIRASAVGYGSGSREISGAANVLRIVRGEGELRAYDRISVLETNVDDVSGETLGRTVSAAIEMGAADAAVYPGTGKKGRPSSLIMILCSPEMINEMTDMVIRQTGTLGVRVTAADRYTLPRENHTATIRIGGAAHTLRYKTHAHRDVTGFKVEADDIARISTATGLPPHQIERLARRQIEDDR